MVPRGMRDILAGPGERWINGHRLPPYTPPGDPYRRTKTEADLQYYWPPAPWRAYISWFLQELTFRFDLYGLWELLCSLDPYSMTASSRFKSKMDRQVAMTSVWGSNSFVPTASSPLVDADWTVRCPAVERLASILRTWPRTTVPDTPRTWESEDDFAQFEREVWFTYAQTYTDYYAREAPLPSPRPPLPWSSDDE